MSKLSHISSRDRVKALQKAGFVLRDKKAVTLSCAEMSRMPKQLFPKTANCHRVPFGVLSEM